MPNINKVIFGNTTLIDLSTTTLSNTDQLESGVTAYDRAGNVITGTSTGTGAGGITQDQDGYLVLDDDAPPGTPTLISKTITENGTYDAEDDSADGYSSVTVNVASGGGGLEYEMGTWTPSADVSQYTISFQNEHTEAPFFIRIVDATGTYSDVTYSNYSMSYFDWGKLFGSTIYLNSTVPRYGDVAIEYRASSATSISNNVTAWFNQPSTYSGATSDGYPRYWATESGFKAFTNSSSQYWRAGRTYKWIAVWAPTT